MITTLILTFFGASSLASVVVFAACVASARADEIQQQAFGHLSEEAEQHTTETQSQAATGSQLALNT